MKYRKTKRLTYSPELLQTALDAINSGTPINTASRKFHIPRSTLHSKVIKKYVSSKIGRDPFLSEEEEGTITKWVQFMCTVGRPVSKEHIVNSAALILKQLNRPNPFNGRRPGRHWYEGFLRRNQGLAQSIRNTIQFYRAVANEDLINKWFIKTTIILRNENLENVKPTRVFNIGETSLLLNPREESINENVEDNEKEKVRVLVTGNAKGQLAPSMIVFDSKQVPDGVYEKLPQGWSVGVSEKGWITAEMFYDYIKSYFYPWLIENNIQLPVILFLDGCVFYMTQLLSEFCHKHQIIIIFIPPNTTRFMHPMDVSLFSQLKKSWEKCVNTYSKNNKVSSISQVDCGPLLLKVFENMNLIEILVNGFRWCGLHPFSVDEVIYTKPFTKRRQNEQIEQLIVLQETEQAKELMLQDTKEKEHVILQETDQPIQVQLQKTNSSHQSQLLQSLERYIDSTTLKIFRSAVDSSDWTGNIEDKNLFHIWKKILHDECPEKQMDIVPRCSRSNQTDSLTELNSLKVKTELIENQKNVHSLNIHLEQTTSNRERSCQTTTQYISRIIDNKELNLVVDLVIAHPNDFIQDVEVDLF